MGAPDLYSTEPIANTGGVGNAAAAGYFGLQQELLRREAVRQAAILQQQVDARNAAKDALDAENIHSEITNRAANTAANEESRKAIAAGREESTNKTWLDTFTATHAPGAKLTPDEKAALAAHGFGSLSLATPVTAPVVVKPAVPAGAPLAPGDQGPVQPAEAAVTEDRPTGATADTFGGTVAQQNDARKREVLQKIANTTDDPAVKTWALGELGGVSIPAGIAREKPTAAETKTQHDLQMDGLEAKITAAGLDPLKDQDKAVKAGLLTNDEAAQLKVSQSRRATDAEKQTNRVTIVNTQADNADTRQEAGFTNTAKRDALTALNKSYDGLNVPRLTRLLQTLKTPGGVNDVVAVPEFLSALAGGMGAGLRMSQAELNMIQKARPLLQSLLIEGQNVIDPTKYRALSQLQRDEMAALAREVAQHNLDLGKSYAKAQRDVRSAPDSLAVQGIMSDLRQEELDAFDEAVNPDKPKTAAKGGLTFNPKTGKVE